MRERIAMVARCANGRAGRGFIVQLFQILRSLVQGAQVAGHVGQPVQVAAEDGVALFDELAVDVRAVGQGKDMTTVLLEFIRSYIAKRSPKGRRS